MNLKYFGKGYLDNFYSVQMKVNQSVQHLNQHLSKGSSAYSPVKK